MNALRAAFLCVIAAPALGQTVDGDVVSSQIGYFEAGILCSPEAIATSPAPDTVAGFTNVIEGEVDLVSHGREVPAVLGVSFGVKSEAQDRDHLDVTMVVTHPPMGPEGVTRQTYLTDIERDATSITFYSLEFDYELVRGDWTFTAMDGKTVLFSAGFTVVDPRQVPDLAGVCGYENLMS